MGSIPAIPGGNSCHPVELKEGGQSLGREAGGAARRRHCMLVQQLSLKQPLRRNGPRGRIVARLVRCGWRRIRVNQPCPPATIARTEPQVGRSVLIDQACRLLGVSKRTVYYWIRAGRLRTVRTLGGSQRILVASIRELAARRAPAGESPLAAGCADEAHVFAPDHPVTDRTSWRGPCSVA
ncbi:MAG: DNA-binding protein [Acidobacteria bacterium]|nr:MAG: DNA-binding protein [Acidobacteriota bacterium]